jgi:uncharacterized protein (UPF0548 family)
MSSRGIDRFYPQLSLTGFRRTVIRSRIGSRLIQGAKRLGVPLLWVGVIAFCGGTGYSAFCWLAAPAGNTGCDRLWLFSPDADKLFCAEQAARSKKVDQLLAGLRLVDGWPSDHPLHQDVAKLQREWTQTLLAIVAQKASNNDLKGAIQLAKQISANNPLYKEAQKNVSDWENNLKQVKAIESDLQVALWSRDWTKAEALLKQLPAQKNDYLQRQVNRWEEQIATEQIAYQQFEQVRQLVTPDPANPQGKVEEEVTKIGEAIRMAMQICPNQYSRIDIQNSIERWSWLLAEKARTHLKQGDVEAAIAAIQWIPDHISLPNDLNQLLWFARARTLATNPPPKIPTQTDLWSVLTTLAAIRQLPANSPFHAQIQSYLPQLEARLQDMTQLTLAEAVGNVQQLPTLMLATQMAQTITPDRPHRIYGQSLIAEWRQGIERAEDRPYLYVAQQLAASGKIPDLQAAIAQASQISLGRALRSDAQAAIFTWQQKIQTIEDRPVLEQAQSLAKQGKLPAAIASAQQIAVGRALYSEAQAAIQTWTATLQTAEDQPILKQANALADQGNLGAALDLASQIAPGRALYDQAQTAIGRWSAQLETTRRSRRSARFDDADRRDRSYSSPFRRR